MYIDVCTLYCIHVYFMYILHQILGFIVRILHFVVNEYTCHGGPCHKPFGVSRGSPQSQYYLLYVVGNSTLES